MSYARALGGVDDPVWWIDWDLGTGKPIAWGHGETAEQARVLFGGPNQRVDVYPSEAAQKKALDEYVATLSFVEAALVKAKLFLASTTSKSSTKVVMGTGTKVAIAAGGLGVAYLLLRKDKR